MDKIYSRRKLKLPSLKVSKIDKIITRKIYFSIIMLIISTLTGYKLLKSIDPIFEGLCTAKAQSIATDITNRKSSEVLARYNYKDTVQIIESEDKKNSILKTDIVTLNQIVSDIAIEIQKELNETGKQAIQIPLGALTGTKYLSATRPQHKNKNSTSRRYCNRYKNRIQISRNKPNGI